MYCYKCGQQISDNTAVCPYCGAVQMTHSAEAQSSSQYNLMCIIGFALSCISLLIDPYGIFAISGIILSVIGLVNARKRNENGRVFGILGTVIGAASLIYVSIQISKIWKYARGLLDRTMGWGWFGNYF